MVDKPLIRPAISWAGIGGFTLRSPLMLGAEGEMENAG